jgi:hypothetical protein
VCRLRSSEFAVRVLEDNGPKREQEYLNDAEDNCDGRQVVAIFSSIRRIVDRHGLLAILQRQFN